MKKIYIKFRCAKVLCVLPGNILTGGYTNKKNLEFLFFLMFLLLLFFLTSHVKCLTLFCITEFICKK